MSDNSEQNGSESPTSSAGSESTSATAVEPAAVGGSPASPTGDTDAIAAAAPAGAEGEGDADESADAGDEEVTTAGTVEAPAGTGKRKRRRRKKRKDAGSATSAGETAAPGEAAKKKESHAPFAHLFSGAQGAKRHAFAAGEVVAGRVQRVADGVIVVDLFGKATAIVDDYEPREIPVLPEPSVEAKTAEEAAAEATTSVQTPAPDASTDAASTATFAPEATSSVGTTVAAQLEGAPEASTATLTGVDAPHAHDEHHEHDEHHDDHAAADADDDAADEHEAAAPAREKPEAPAIGQVFKGRVGAVAESGHIVLLNRIIDVPAARALLEQRRNEHKRVEGVVYGFNRGGFDVMVEGLRAFCPASAMALSDIADPLEYVGKKLEFLLPASKAGSRDIIVSRRSILERLQRRKTKELLRSITSGQRFKGKVTAVRDFGLFVDIGGVEGLVHQSELSYAFGVRPSSVAKVGDEIEVQVLRVGGEPKREESGRRDRVTRVSLSVKALLPDPWDEHAAELAEGTIRKGKVSRATEFGAFIELAPAIEGLLHITELGRDLKHANQAVKEGDELYVAIDRVDRRARRISLSKLSSAEAQEFEAGTLTQDDAAAKALRQGNNVKIKIERIEPRCVFGRVVGTIGKRGRVFMPNSETGTERGTDLRKKFPPGTELEAKIIGIDRDGSLKCSIKAMQIDEERQAVKNYRREAAKQGFGTFGDLLRAKLGEASK